MQQCPYIWRNKLTTPEWTRVKSRVYSWSILGSFSPLCVVKWLLPFFLIRRRFWLTGKQTDGDGYGTDFLFMFELKACWNNLFKGLHGVWQMRYEVIKVKDGRGPISSERSLDGQKPSHKGQLRSCPGSYPCHLHIHILYPHFPFVITLCFFWEFSFSVELVVDERDCSLKCPFSYWKEDWFLIPSTLFSVCWASSWGSSFTVPDNIFWARVRVFLSVTSEDILFTGEWIWQQWNGHPAPPLPSITPPRPFLPIWGGSLGAARPGAVKPGTPGTGRDKIVRKEGTAVTAENSFEEVTSLLCETPWPWK